MIFIKICDCKLVTVTIIGNQLPMNYFIIYIDQNLDVGNFQNRVKLELWQNYSPCDPCCSALLSLQPAAGQISFRFAGLYKIEDTANQNGLRKLSFGGFQLSTFRQTDWQTLAGFLGENVHQYNMGIRYSSDYQEAQNLSYVLAQPPTANN